MARMQTRTKLLFVVSNFWQAGAQRYFYELDKVINRKKFEVHILSLYPLNSSTKWKDYYYILHQKNGSKIHFYQNQWFQRIRTSLAYRTGHKNFRYNNQLNKFFDQYDVVNWVGEYTFNYLSTQIKEEIIDKSIIHIMTSKAQTHPINNYSEYDKEKFYNFVSFLPSEPAVKYELSDFKHYSHTHIPLFFEIKNTENRWQFKENKYLKKIGIFTRLDHLKPLDPFFYAFHILLDNLPNLELHIFGTGDPDESGATRFTKNLHIQNKVKFRGHVSDISQTANKEKLDLIWFQGMYGNPGGYAGYELCLTGIPQIYWEIVSDVEERLINECYPCFSNLNNFIKHSQLLLTDEVAAEAQSKIQFNTTKDEKDVRKWVSKLEELFMLKNN